MSNKILVLGGTGKTGKRIADRLTKLNLPVRIGSRQASPCFDWDNENTWEEALNGIEKVYITYQPDLAVPDAIPAIQKFVEASKKAGVKKLVLLSGRGEKETETSEAIVMNSRLDWTIVRASWFMQNFSENFLSDGILQREVILPKVKALEPFVDIDDIADVVVETLTKDIHSKKVYELTGPELLSFEKVIDIISKTINEEIDLKQISMEEYTAMLKSYKIPEDFIWLIQYLFTEVLDGRNESISTDIEKVLGRKAGTFKAYTDKTFKTGVWNINQN